MTLSSGLSFLIYFALFVLSVVALLWWRRRQYKRRLPFPTDIRLLRAPGETQLGLVHKLEEQSVFWILAAGGAPLLVLMGLLAVVLKLPEVMQPGGAAVALLVAAAVFVAAARWFTGKAVGISNRYLGYFGERVVAEYLEPLKAAGWRIFHDVPGRAGGFDFNVDHVAIGPGGVFVVETKTRRKGAARPGYEDFKVYYDGHSLVWPWGEDSHGLAQAEAHATWLTDTLLAETGERIAVVPVLALPGWWVEMKPAREPRPCRVTNPKNLTNTLGALPPVLDSEQITQLAAKLEARCRTVEY